ncbi:ABC transporter ATP-binding protein [Cohnella panacarvi]|uniref:ABC transporter ATP-binding protein n=1 Tax=Cohnella panacarvi TaxID=400776 RepID=UPI000479507D|nr:ABC transporter ATP-binding protein [Cohnella panacarvi]
MQSSAVTLKPGQTLMKMLKWARRYWASYLAVSGIVIVSSLLPVGWAEGMRRLFEVTTSLSTDGLLTTGFWLAGLFVIEQIVTVIRAWLSQKLSNRTTLDLQHQVLGGLLAMKMKRFTGLHTGDKLQRINQSAVAAQDGINQRIPGLIHNGLSVLFLFAYLTVLSWELMAGALGVALLMPLLSNLFSKPIRKWNKLHNESQAVTNARLLDQLQGAEVVRSFGLRQAFGTSWKEDYDASRRNWLRGDLYRVITNRFVGLGFWLGEAYILGLGAWMANRGTLEIGAIAAFVLSYERLIFPLAYMVNLWASVQESVAHAGRVYEVFDPTESSASAKKRAKASEEKADFDGDIVMNEVTFNYQEQPALDRFSAVFRRGSMTAIVGPSGGGKSTLLKLILGLYEPDSGTIRCGETALSDDLLAQWRKRIAYVPQDAAVFDAAVMDNIRVGRLEADDSEVIDAARLANAHSFIDALPDKYETRIGERGQRLSGGERQRLALARAYIRKPDILLLDEPTSALDAINEKLMQEALQQMMKGRTVIVAAHRLSTVRDADCILFVENGKVLESGTHDELLRLGGRYASLIRSGEWANHSARRVIL